MKVHLVISPLVPLGHVSLLITSEYILLRSFCFLASSTSKKNPCSPWIESSLNKLARNTVLPAPDESNYGVVVHNEALEKVNADEATNVKQPLINS